MIADDPVEHPVHYTSHASGIECITITEHMGFNLGNALKYIWRADLKGDVLEDLRKARWYLDRELARREHAKPQMAYGDTEQEARAKADELVEENDRAKRLGKAYAESIVDGAERIFHPHTPRDIPPPTSAKMRHCVGCGTSHPMTSIGGRLVEHWDPATLSNIPGPTICDQHERKAEQS